jgi:hypothetical protein
VPLPFSSVSFSFFMSSIFIKFNLSLTDSSCTSLIKPTETYEMISTCNTDLAEWSDDGETFVVKNSSKFAQQEIPKFFDHKNFASFSRQLNFYGFRKVPHKIIRIDKQYDKQSSRYVRFQNEYFKRGRIDLLKNIRRSTKNAGVAQNQVQEVTDLKTKVSSLETQVTTMSREIELLQKQVRKILYHSAPSPTKYSQIENPSEVDATTQVNQEYYEYESSIGGLPPSSGDVCSEQVPSMGFADSRGNQNQAENANHMNAVTPPTLAPHPNTKQLDPNDLPRPSSVDYSMRELSIGFIDMNFEFDGDTGSSSNENHVNNVEV